MITIFIPTKLNKTTKTKIYLKDKLKEVISL